MAFATPAKAKTRRSRAIRFIARPIGTVTSYGNILDRLGKHRRGGYVFITWKGDHPPRHVHVYRDGTLIVKWDLDNQKPMKGAATRRILELIAQLESEGAL